MESGKEESDLILKKEEAFITVNCRYIVKFVE